MSPLSDGVSDFSASDADADRCKIRCKRTGRAENQLQMYNPSDTVLLLICVGHGVCSLPMIYISVYGDSLDDPVHPPLCTPVERGQIFELCGKRVFTMGGGSSHDIQGGVLETDDPWFLQKFHVLNAKGAAFRINHQSWWKEELPSKEEYLEARRNLGEAGWKVDYIITHCAPTSIQNELLREMPKPDELTDFQEEVLQRCRFQYPFFGHYHGDGIIQKQFVLLYDRFCD